VFGDASPLTLAALAAWVATAAFGANLLLRGKAYRLLLSAVAARTSSQPRRPILRATVMTLHWLDAVSGLILWTGYALSDRRPLAQSALICLVRWRCSGSPSWTAGMAPAGTQCSRATGADSLCGRQRFM
jgi:hypothetical protein